MENLKVLADKLTDLTQDELEELNEELAGELVITRGGGVQNDTDPGSGGNPNPGGPGH